MLAWIRSGATTEFIREPRSCVRRLQHTANQPQVRIQLRWVRVARLQQAVASQRTPQRVSLVKDCQTQQPIRLCVNVLAQAKLALLSHDRIHEPAKPGRCRPLPCLCDCAKQEAQRHHESFFVVLAEVRTETSERLTQQRHPLQAQHQCAPEGNRSSAVIPLGKRVPVPRSDQQDRAPEESASVESVGCRAAPEQLIRHELVRLSPANERTDLAWLPLQRTGNTARANDALQHSQVGLVLKGNVGQGQHIEFPRRHHLTKRPKKCAVVRRKLLRNLCKTLGHASVPIQRHTGPPRPAVNHYTLMYNFLPSIHLASHQ